MSGLLLGTVVDNNDPEKRGRVKVKCPELLLDPETLEVLVSPWCESATMSFGSCVVPPIGTSVYLQQRASDDGSLYQLIYSPGRPGARADGTSALPKLATGDEDETTGGLKAGVEFQVPSIRNVLELQGGNGSVTREEFWERDTIPGVPSSFNGGDYPNNKVLKTPAGVALEFDDTPGAERIHVWHPSGAYVEINAKGVVVRRQNKEWVETTDSLTESIGTDQRTCVRGNRQTLVGKHDVTEVGGRMTVDAGELGLQSHVNMVLQAGGSFQFTGGGTSSFDFLGGARMTAGDNFSLGSLGKLTLQGVGGVSLNSVLGPVTVSGVLPIPPAPVANGALLVSLLEALFTILATHVHPPEAPSVELAAATSAAMALLPTILSTSLWAN